MKKSYLRNGIVLAAIGFVLIIFSVNTSSDLSGLLAGFGGGALGPGIAMIIKYLYYNTGGREAEYEKILENVEIEQKDELNIKIRDKAGRKAFIITLIMTIVLEVLFLILGVLGLIPNYLLLVIIFFIFAVFQVVIATILYNQILKEYK